MRRSSSGSATCRRSTASAPAGRRAKAFSSSRSLRAVGPRSAHLAEGDLIVAIDGEKVAMWRGSGENDEARDRRSRRPSCFRFGGAFGRSSSRCKTAAVGSSWSWIVDRRVSAEAELDERRSASPPAERAGAGHLLRGGIWRHRRRDGADRQPTAHARSCASGRTRSSRCA